MQMEQAVGEFQTYKTNINSVAKLLGEIARLEHNRSENLGTLRARLAKLEDTTRQLKQVEAPFCQLDSWATQYGQELGESFEQVKRHFGAELERELQKQNLPLWGQYPQLRAGLFALELDLDKDQVTIWYGPKHERLGQCRPSPVEVANCIEKAKQNLGSRLEETALLQKLGAAVSRARSGASSEPVPIIQVLGELAHMMQDSRFCQDPRRENYRSYSRADFSYDLYRLRGEKGLRLVTATRSQTQHRGDFLWVPTGLERGEGAAYSRLQVVEEEER